MAKLAPRAVAVLAATGLTPLVQAAPSVQQLEDRLSEVEKQLQDAEGDELPWDKYVDEVGGRLMFDETVRTDSDSSLEQAVNGGDPLEEGAEFRRLRLYMEGAVAENIGYKVQLGFAGNNVEAKSVYVKAHDLGVLPTIKVGHFKEPFSLQELTSSKYITLMSRSMLTDFFSSSYKGGFQISDHFLNDRLNYRLGAFHSGFQDGAKETQAGVGQDYNITGRVTSPVLYAQEGRQVLHLGAVFQQRAADSIAIGLEPGVHKTNDFMSGTINNVDGATTYGGEVAGVFGPVYMQGEYAQMDVNTNAGTDPSLNGYYVQGGWLLTGEYRPYDKADGEFDRIEPANPMTGWGEGTGAWGVAARYSSMDLTEAADTASFSPGFTAGNAQDSVAETDVTTVGLNWYPTAHAKWMLNYVAASQDSYGDASYVTSRFQVDF